MKTRMIYVAFDDKPFESAEACKAYEAQHVETRLVGLTIEQVRAALSREDPDLADAIETVGNRIVRERREAGDLRRGKKATVEDVREPSAEKAMEDRGREAHRSGCDRDPPDDVPDAMIKIWLMGFDYEMASKRAAA